MEVASALVADHGDDESGWLDDGMEHERANSSEDELLSAVEGYYLSFSLLHLTLH